MKRLILFLLLLAAPLYAAEPFEIARTNPYVAGGNYAAAAPACTTSNDSELVSITADAANAETSYTKWQSQQFTITSGTTITQWIFHANAAGATGNTICSLYSDSSNKPSTEISGSQVSVSNAFDTDTDVVFTLSTPKTIAATLFHVVCRTDTNGQTIYIRSGNASTYAGGGFNQSTDSGANWGTQDVIDHHISIYGCAAP